MYYNATCGHKRTLLKKDTGNKTGWWNVDGDGKGGNLMTREKLKLLWKRDRGSNRKNKLTMEGIKIK